MIYTIRKFSIVLSAILLLSCNHQKSSYNEVVREPLETFDDMKFGMFIHWGLYSISAGEWENEKVRGLSSWIMHRKEIPVDEYSRLAERFNPIKYDPYDWAQLAEDAGMKYMVITSKHHDGFSMFNSKVSDYNIVDATPYAKDPMTDLSNACREKGIHFGFYYSQDQDWYEPNARGNTWDFPEERDAQLYIKGKAIPQINELLSNYGDIALLWFDTPGLLTKEQVLDLRKTVKTLQPNCLINSRIGHNQHDYYQSGDNGIPIQVYTKEKWEVPATLNDTWGYKKNDINWKSPKDLVCKLSDIVSKGGNYLLNVGPTAEGSIPKESQEILRTIGAWLDINGEAIYATSPSPFSFPDITWRCTVKPGKVYLHILNWPGNEFHFSGLENKIDKAWFLANGESIPFSQNGNKVKFNFPHEAVDSLNTIVVLDISENDVIVSKGYENSTMRDSVDLFSWSARSRGEELKYDWKSMSVENFIHADYLPNELWWHLFEYIEIGSYSVEVTYACENEAAKNTVYIESTVDDWEIDKEINFVVEDTKGQFITVQLDEPLEIKADSKEIRLGIRNAVNPSSIKIKKIRLVKVS